MVDFGSRDREFSLRRYRTGFLLPDLRLQFDGAVFEVSAHQTVYEDSDLRFFAGGSEVLTRAHGEAWLAELIEDVLKRLVGRGVDGTSAQLRWARVLHSRRSVERNFCEAAGSLGLDPYALVDEAAQFIEDAERFFGSERLIEFVSGARDVDKARLITWVAEMAGRVGDNHRVDDLRPIVDSIAREIPERPTEQPWGWGYRRARAIRRTVDLKQGQRLSSFRDLARLFGAGKRFNVARNVDGIRALRSEGPHGIHVHLRDHGHAATASSAHLFAMSRSIGDAACFPAPETAPINRVRNAYRQAAGRAFAAEFLAPIDEVLSMRDDRRDLYSIASELGVSPTVVQHQLENQHRIAEACA